jgi:hypothetical protein
VRVKLFGEDTRPEIEDRMIEMLRRMPPERKLAKIFDLGAAARELSAARIRAEHPELEEREVRLRVGELVYGKELIAKVRRGE